MNKARNFKLKDNIVPATLEEISDEGLIGYIDTVKQYNIENGKVVGILYPTGFLGKCNEELSTSC